MRLFADDAKTGIIPLEVARTMRGIDVFAEMIAGRLPAAPIAKTLNFTLVSAEEGLVEFRGVPLPEHYNPLGTVHGGWVATIMDSALGCCVHTMLPPATGYTTIEFKVNLIRPLFERTGEVTCIGKVIHLGRTTAVSEAKLTTADGKLVAFGTETCAIFPLPPQA